MRIRYFQLNSFTAKGFLGNPAGVCILESWLTEQQMQFIAAENMLSETAFLVGSEAEYDIRWFTPKLEVDLCGHATLASAAALFEKLSVDTPFISFHSKSGLLKVRREENLYIMNFPTDRISPAEGRLAVNALNCKPSDVLRGKTDLLIVLDSEEEIRSLKPDMEAMMELEERGVIVTAKGKQVDFVSRFFAPQSGIPEDPVTGSAHTTLTPYWAEKLGRNNLKAWQLSSRGGEVYCRLMGERVELGGKTRLYKEGYIHVE